MSIEYDAEDDDLGDHSEQVISTKVFTTTHFYLIRTHFFMGFEVREMFEKIFLNKRAVSYV